MNMQKLRHHWLGGLQRGLAAGLLLALAQFAFAASDYSATWGPAVGSMAPLLSAEDQNGRLQKLDTLTGSSGLLLVFNRSVDW